MILTWLRGYVITWSDNQHHFVTAPVTTATMTSLYMSNNSQEVGCRISMLIFKCKREACAWHCNKCTCIVISAHALTHYISRVDMVWLCHTSEVDPGSGILVIRINANVLGGENKLRRRVCMYDVKVCGFMIQRCMWCFHHGVMTIRTPSQSSLADIHSHWRDDHQCKLFHRSKSESMRAAPPSLEPLSPSQDRP